MLLYFSTIDINQGRVLVVQFFWQTSHQGDDTTELLLLLLPCDDTTELPVLLLSSELFYGINLLPRICFPSEHLSPIGFEKNYSFLNDSFLLYAIVLFSSATTSLFHFLASVLLKHSESIAFSLCSKEGREM